MTIGTLTLMTLGTALLASRSADQKLIEDVVVEFARAGDRRDLAELERVLDPSFRVVASFPGKESASVLSRTDYLALMRDGKIGGGQRTLSFDSIRVAGAIAHASVRMERTDASFEAVLTLVRSGSGWRLVQDATRMTPKG